MWYCSWVLIIWNGVIHFFCICWDVNKFWVSFRLLLFLLSQFLWLPLLSGFWKCDMAIDLQPLKSTLRKKLKKLITHFAEWKFNIKLIKLWPSYCDQLWKTNRYSVQFVSLSIAELFNNTINTNVIIWPISNKPTSPSKSERKCQGGRNYQSR